MDRPYVEELRIQSYGCIQDATFCFTPLHALIGPNDSGKSTVLRALRTLAFIFTLRSGEREGQARRRAIEVHNGEATPRFEASTRNLTWAVELDGSVWFKS